MPSSSSSPQKVSVLLGLFVLWQLVFIPLSNTLLLIRDYAEEDSPSARAVDHLAGGPSRGEGQLVDVIRLCNRWVDLTGQEQGWNLFSPGVSDHASFPSVEFRWADRAAPVLLLPAVEEPEDVARYLRLGGFRLRSYEAKITVEVSLREGETAEEAAPRWRAQIARKVRRRWDAIQSYLSWRWQSHRREHPGDDDQAQEPDEMILHVRSYAVPPAWGVQQQQRPWAYRGPFVTPVARYRPRQPAPPGALPVEAFDPESQQFHYLGR